MRAPLLLMFFSISLLSLRAQNSLGYGVMNDFQATSFSHYNQVSDSSNLNKKWFLSKSFGISNSFVFFNGGKGTILSAPVSLQLNHRLTNHLYAFAGVYAAPSFVNFNSSFRYTDLNKSNSGRNFLNTDHLGIYSGVQAGLMYINEEKTFSISGSINISRSSYPIYTPNTTRRQQPVISPSR